MSLTSLALDAQRRGAPPSAVRLELLLSFLPSWRTQCNIVVVVVAAAATCDSGDGPKIVENARAPETRGNESVERGGADGGPATTCDCLLWASLPRSLLRSSAERVARKV